MTKQHNIQRAAAQGEQHAGIVALEHTRRRADAAMQQACRREGDYLVVGVALRVKGGERRSRDLTEPSSLLLRPRLLIKGTLRRFYLRYVQTELSMVTR